MKEKPKNNRDTASSWVCVFIKQVPTRFKHILHEESSKNTSDTMYSTLYCVQYTVYSIVQSVAILIHLDCVSFDVPVYFQSSVEQKI